MIADSRWTSVRVAKDRVVVWGASDQFRVNYPILRSLGCRVEALIDDTPGMVSPIEGLPLFPGEDGLDRFLETTDADELGFVVAIGNPYGDVRMSLHRLMRGKGMTAVSFADRTALICTMSNFGEGLQVMPAAIVHTNARIGRQCIINTRALVEHDCVLGDGVEIGPGAVLCGRVHVGDHSWVAANATILPRMRIGANTIIGAGAVVVSDIPSNVIAVGVPARVTQQNRAT